MDCQSSVPLWTSPLVAETRDCFALYSIEMLINNFETTAASLSTAPPHLGGLKQRNLESKHVKLCLIF